MGILFKPAHFLKCLIWGRTYTVDKPGGCSGTIWIFLISASYSLLRRYSGGIILQQFSLSEKIEVCLREKHHGQLRLQMCFIPGSVQDSSLHLSKESFWHLPHIGVESEGQTRGFCAFRETHQKGRICLSGETTTACFHRAMVRPSNGGATRGCEDSYPFI